MKLLNLLYSAYRFVCKKKVYCVFEDQDQGSTKTLMFIYEEKNKAEFYCEKNPGSYIETYILH